MNYYHRHLGDYAKDTTNLSMTEHGAYNLLLDRYYGTEKGIPADQVYRAAKAATKEDRKAVDFVLKEFFQLKHGTWVSKRCDEEIQTAQHRIEQARLNGKRGGRPGAHSDNEQEPGGFPPGSNPLTGSKALQSPISIPQSIEPEREENSLSFDIPSCPRNMDTAEESASFLAYYEEEGKAPTQRLWVNWVERAKTSGVYRKRNRPATSAEIAAERAKIIAAQT